MPQTPSMAPRLQRYVSGITQIPCFAVQFYHWTQLKTGVLTIGTICKGDFPKHLLNSFSRFS